MIPVRLPSNGVQQRLPPELSSRFRVPQKRDRVEVEYPSHNFLPHRNIVPSLPQLKTQTFHNLAIHKIQQAWAVDRATLPSPPSAAEHRRVFQPDNSRPDHDQSRGILPGNAPGPNPRCASRPPEFPRYAWAGTASNQNFLLSIPAGLHLRSRSRSCSDREVGVAFQRRDIIAPQLRLDHVYFPRHHRVARITRSTITIRSFTTYPRP